VGCEVNVLLTELAQQLCGGRGTQGGRRQMCR
jgi:hypothetical protein